MDSKNRRKNHLKIILRIDGVVSIGFFGLQNSVETLLFLIFVLFYYLCVIPYPVGKKKQSDLETQIQMSQIDSISKLTTKYYLFWSFVSRINRSIQSNVFANLISINRLK